MSAKKINNNSILVVLTAAGGVGVYLEAMRDTPYERDKHFRTFTNTEGVEGAVRQGSEQLLFVDLLSFDIKTTVDFVKRMKSRNNRLIAILYSTFPNPNPIFDGYVVGFDDVLADFAKHTTQFLEH
jgi:hypothetical protein